MQGKAMAGMQHLQAEADGQLEVQLHRGALELPSEGIKHRDVDLGPVECAICWIELDACHTIAISTDPHQVSPLCNHRDAAFPAPVVFPDFIKGSVEALIHFSLFLSNVLLTEML